MDYQRNIMRQSYDRERRRAQSRPAFAEEKTVDVKSKNEDDIGLFGRSLAMVYSPYQFFENLYDVGDGISRGTIFRDLDKPLNVRRDC